MILYLVKSSLCLLLLWGFYSVFLEKENIHFLKRFYLLFSVVFALIIPMITLTYEIEVLPQPEVVLESKYVIEASIPNDIDKAPLLIEKRRDYMPIFLWSIYGVGVLIFGIRFIRNIRNITGKIKNNQRIPEESHINVLLPNSIIPHTFLSYVFVPKKEFQDNNIPVEVLLHEKTHVVQKHTLDILFVEILQVLFWFNPLLFFIKKSIKLNHEFLADHNVLKQQFSIQNYIDLLLTYPNSPNQAVVSSSINYSLTKKRLQMMTQKFSKKRTVLKLTALLPIVCLCILFFNNQIIAKEVLKPFDEHSIEEIPNSMNSNESISTMLEDKAEKKVTLLQSTVVDFQDGVTKEQLAAYNTWIIEFKRRQEEKGFTVSNNEVEAMRSIYQAMNTTQKNEVGEFPDILIPPPPIKSSLVQKGEESTIPSSPSVPANPAAPVVPAIPAAPEGPSVYNGKDFEIKFSDESDLTEEEKKAYIKRVEAVFTKEQALIERENAIEQAELARFKAANTQDIAEARQRAQEARISAIEARAIAREAAQKARTSVRIAATQARKEAIKAREGSKKNARNTAIEAREVAERAVKRAQEQARKAAKEAKKSAIKARKETLKTSEKGTKIIFTAPTEGFDGVILNGLSIKEAEEQGAAEFYNNEKRISYEEAQRLMNDAGGKSFSLVIIQPEKKNDKYKIYLKN